MEKWPVVKEGEKAKDFVNRLLTQGEPQPQQPQQTVESVIQEVKAQVAPEPAPKLDFVKPQIPETQPETLKGPEAQIQAIEEDKEPEGSLSANYKLLKNKHKETKQIAAKLAQEKTKLEEDLEKYKNGVVVPDILQEKENEIARLSTYERLFNIKGTKAYKEQVVEPLSQKDRELKQLFKDYDLSESEIPKFMGITNRADRNRFLSDHFDSRGADQVERLLAETESVRARAKELESGSSTAIKDLEAEQARIDEQREVQRKNTIAANAQDSWVRALTKIRSENQIKELIPKPNDTQFNETIVRPILTAASVEYGKFVTHLAESGIQDLKPELAEYAARMSLLAHASAVATKTRDAALSYAEEVEVSNRVTNGYLRPQIGGGTPSIQATQPPKQTLEQGIEGVLNKVLSKR